MYWCLGHSDTRSWSRTINRYFLVHDHKRQLQKSNSSTRLLCEFKIEVDGISTRQDNFSRDIFINADKIRINQVLDNLLTNAIKFTKEGIVSISTKYKKGENHTDTIITSVRDTGTGINPEILPSLFSKFGSRSEMA